MARPPKWKSVPASEVESLARLGCRLVEISGFTGLSVRTLRRRFSDHLIRGRAAGKVQLRQWQWQQAGDGKVSMLIWLGRQVLSQYSSQSIGREAERRREFVRQRKLQVAAEAQREFTRSLMEDPERRERVVALAERSVGIYRPPTPKVMPAHSAAPANPPGAQSGALTGDDDDNRQAPEPPPA